MEENGRERARVADSNGRPTFISHWILAREGTTHDGWINTARLRAKFTNPPCMIEWKGVGCTCFLFLPLLFLWPVTTYSSSLFSHFSLGIHHSAICPNCFWSHLIVFIHIFFNHSWAKNPNLIREGTPKLILFYGSLRHTGNWRRRTHRQLVIKTSTVIKIKESVTSKIAQKSVHAFRYSSALWKSRLFLWHTTILR